MYLTYQLTAFGESESFSKVMNGGRVAVSVFDLQLTAFGENSVRVRTMTLLLLSVVNLVLFNVGLQSFVASEVVKLTLKGDTIRW